MALATIAIALLLTFPGWHEETMEDSDEIRDVKPFPSRPITQIILVATVAASLLALVSMMWQHTASVAVATTVQDLGYGTINSKVGALAMALGWAGLGCVVIAAIGILVLILSIGMFTDMTEEQ